MLDDANLIENIGIINADCENRKQDFGVSSVTVGRAEATFEHPKMKTLLNKQDIDIAILL